MIPSNDETRASLIIVSDLLTGQQIADQLGTEPTKVVLKGTPTTQPVMPQHPMNIAMFASGVGIVEELETHIEALVSFCEERKDTIIALMKACRVTIHCSYSVGTQGGWRLAPELCQRMASLPIEFVFNVETKKQKKTKGEHQKPKEG